LTTTGYHSDVSYEHQTPAITILTLLQVPSTGGDTGWVSQIAAYERLSEPIQKLLEGLRAEHSGFPQAEGATRDGKHVRRAPVISKHPIVRIHPATGQKALFINPGFTKRIEGLKEEESDALLKLLFAVSSVAFRKSLPCWKDRRERMLSAPPTAYLGRSRSSGAREVG
jgi:sulfonate dioxygenase